MNPPTVSLPWPSSALSPNARGHWAIRAKAAKKARSDAWFAAQGRGFLWACEGAEKVLVRITFHPPDRRRRDRDNMIACFKAYADGLADAMGVDDSRWEPTYAVGEPVKGGRVDVEARPA